MTTARLAGKTAIIVGAGQQPGTTLGNGRATAERFAEEGATCLLVDINPEWAEDTLKAVTDRGAAASVFQADITDEDQCRAIVAACVERYGRIDILHNNVGRSQGDKGTSELAAAVWDDLFAMNLKGMFMTCKHALPVMREQGAGAIINISSTSSLSHRPTIAYKTSKGAINTMTQHIAAENAPFGIRANAILPGLIDTPMAIERRSAESGKSREAIRAERDSRVPMGKMGTAWDVANAAVFLASEEARYITGVVLPVDGGLSARVG